MAAPESAPPSEASAEPEFDFQAIYERTRGKKCTVAEVRLVGNSRTKDHIIFRELPLVRLRAAAFSPVT
jgi:outer membrane protein assembly factor BamA